MKNSKNHKKNYTSLENLPIKHYEEGRPFRGHEEELQQLVDFWNNEQVNLVSVISDGGFGKTTLAYRWLEKIRQKETIEFFVWSFYKQGSNSNISITSDSFVDEFLEVLKLKDTEENIPLAPDARGKLLANAVAKRRFILILDGLETLQERKAEGRGKIHDIAVRTMLDQLAGYNPGLCFITSRENLTGNFPSEPKKRTIRLSPLKSEQAILLLKDRKVSGSKEELQKACNEYKNWPLALILLANILQKNLNGEIERRNELPLLSSEESNIPWAPLFKVISAAYKNYEGEVQQHLLLLLGFFDRPVKKSVLKKLIGKQGFSELSPGLQKLTQDDLEWDKTIKEMIYSSELLYLSKNDNNREDQYDCHPYIRQFLSIELKKPYLNKTYKEGHYRLTEIFSAASDKVPNSRIDCEYLYRAIKHACACGAYQKALMEIYFPRLHGSQEKSPIKRFGLYGYEEDTLSLFFDNSWKKPIPEINIEQSIMLLNIAGLVQRAREKLYKCIDILRVGFEKSLESGNELYKARFAGQLCLSYLLSGNIPEGKEWGQKGVECAQLTENDFEVQKQLAFYGSALHRANEMNDAKKAFEEAEKIQRIREPERPYLYYIPGYLYCEFLLDNKHPEELLKRARWMEHNVYDENAQSRGITNMMLGWAALLNPDSDKGLEKSLKPPRTPPPAQVNQYLSDAVGIFKRLGTNELLITALRLQGLAKTARGKNGIEELILAQELAESSGMQLFETDVAIDLVEHHCIRKEKEDAQKHLRKAQMLAHTQGYAIRELKLKKLEREINNMTNTLPPNLKNIKLWSEETPPEPEMRTEALGNQLRERVLTNLTKYGIAKVRINGLTPEEGPLFSLANMIGKPAEEQNNFTGWCKEIIPTLNGQAGGGNTIGDLGFHVDGTQHEEQPAILIFQYISTPTAGADSVFVDVAGALSALDETERQTVILDLSRSDAATFSKGDRTLVAPIFTAATDYSLKCRLRFDDVIKINEKCRESYEKLARLLKSPEYHLRFLPEKGDYVIFDNWRLMHARDRVYGSSIRSHYRVWINSLHRGLIDECFLGIRPVDNKTLVNVGEYNSLAHDEEDT